MRNLRDNFPNAINIRWSGKCPSCGEYEEYSFQLPDICGDIGEDREECGYFCCSCDFSNAGSRYKWETTSRFS